MLSVLLVPGWKATYTSTNFNINGVQYIDPMTSWWALELPPLVLVVEWPPLRPPFNSKRNESSTDWVLIVMWYSHTTSATMFCGSKHASCRPGWIGPVLTFYHVNWSKCLAMPIISLTQLSCFHLHGMVFVGILTLRLDFCISPSFAPVTGELSGIISHQV